MHPDQVAEAVDVFAAALHNLADAFRQAGEAFVGLGENLTPEALNLPRGIAEAGPEEPVTPDGLRRLLGAPGDGGVRFDTEGGFRPSPN
jgi:hypothetical protein